MKLSSFLNNAGVGGEIWMFWDADLEFEFIDMSNQAINGWFVHGNFRVFTTFVHASCFRAKRVELWDFLKMQNSSGLPWFIGGDFNVIRDDSEKVGGLLQAFRAKSEFNQCIHDCALVDLPYEGNHFSWCNGQLGGRRIWERLDHILVNLQFTSFFGIVKVTYLPRSSSDYAPMLVQLIRKEEHIVRPFRFLRMWGTHEGFLPLVREIWNSNLEGCAMVRINSKLKRLKGALRRWNRDYFGWVETKLK